MKTGRLVAPLAVLLLAHCGDAGSEAAPSALGEPLRVRVTLPGSTKKVDAQFVPGPLVEGIDGPTIPDSLTFKTFVFYPGQAGKTVNGAVDLSATAVGMRFADLGTGYWIVPVQTVSVYEFPGYLEWAATFELASDVPIGSHEL
jgi:hypothetical protein